MQTLMRMLRTCLDHQYAHWDALLPLLMFAYRTAKQSSTGVTPALAVGSALRRGRVFHPSRVVYRATVTAAGTRVLPGAEAPALVLARVREAMRLPTR